MAHTHAPNELEDNKVYCQTCGSTSYFVNKYQHPEVDELLWLEIICDNCALTRASYELYKDQVFMPLQPYEECGVTSFEGLHHCPQHPCTHKYDCPDPFNY